MRLLWISARGFGGPSSGIGTAGEQSDNTRATAVFCQVSVRVILYFPP